MSVPALRFKDDGGQDFPDWKVKPISELAIKVIDGDRGQNYPNGNDFSNDGYCLFLNAKNVTKSGFAFEELSFITKEKDEQLRKGKLSKNDLIITTRGSVGNIAHFDNEVKYVNMRINSGMVILRNQSTDISPNYLYQYFYSPKFTKSVQQIAFGSAQPQLTVLEIKKFIVGLPLIKEQTKIANFLTAVDEKISQLTQKHDLLTQYKKGVMQQIFRQELRFKDDDGSDFPEWEEKELRTLCDLITKGTTPTSVGHEFKTSGIYFIKIESLEADGKLIKEKLGFIDSDAHAKLLRSQLKLNDLLFSIAGALGRVAIVTDEFLPANTNQALAIIRLSEGQVLDTKFVFYALKNDRIKKLIESISVQLAQANLSLKDIGDFVILLPCIEEQTKIANYLTAIDKKITATQTQLQAVKQYKQGLLQQMFV